MNSKLALFNLCFFAAVLVVKANSDTVKGVLLGSMIANNNHDRHDHIVVYPVKRYTKATRPTTTTLATTTTEEGPHYMSYVMLPLKLKKVPTTTTTTSTSTTTSTTTRAPKHKHYYW